MSRIKKATEVDEVKATEVEKTPVETPATKGKTTKTVFHLNDVVIKTRIFSEEEHGKDWREIADEFAVTNARKIRSREDL